jgi:hypothetical protein
MVTTRDLPGLRGARVAEHSPYRIGLFIDEYLGPLLFWRSYDPPKIYSCAASRNQVCG